MPEELREAFDEVMASYGGAQPGGPGSVTIHSPELARKRAPANGYLRFETSVPAHILELSVLTTARTMDCAYVWNAHVAPARKAGVSDALIDAMRDRKPLPAMKDDEAALMQYASELFSSHKVSDAAYQAALTQFGTLHLVEITAVLGQYVQNAFLINAFAVDLPDTGGEPALPV
jgi:4-carboxymuconolactone decarboxylase